MYDICSGKLRSDYNSGLTSDTVKIVHNETGYSEILAIVSKLKFSIKLLAIANEVFTT